ncbi:ABC transporter ATP-binding protein [Pseudonocardia sp.]|jgi:putative ABC transport system ATP-binding protein|uniref:ABC transporter ATP-binding protein n=1 Tax=Pseudonocardia sp. TaxID=60912 RepID=UPI0031FC9F45
MTPQVITGRAVLLDSIRHHRRQLITAAVLLCGHQGGEALVPVLVGVVIDGAVGTGDTGSLLFWLAVLGLDFLALSFSYRFGARRAWLADVRADQRMRHAVADRVLHPAGGAETGRLPGALTSIAVADAKRVGVLNFALPLGLAAFAALVVAAVSLLRISLPLGLLILLGTPPLLYAVHLLGKPLERRSGPEQERAAQASGVAADLVAGVRVLKGIGAEPAAVRRYTATSRDALAATLRATGAQAWYSGAVLAVNGLFLALVALVGGRLAAEGDITIGGLVSAVGLAQFLLGPLEIFGWVNGRFAQARASAARIAEVRSAAPAVSGGTAAPVADGPGHLRIRGLRTPGLAAGVDLDVAAGETVGLVVPDPAVAAALLQVLGREQDPQAGSVELDGVDLARMPPAAARAEVIVAAHDARLFAGTVLENVLAGRGAGPGDPAVDGAMRAAQADQVADALPDGRDTEIAEQGSSLSGGQRQRVALARALAAQARVLVLHDPTTAVDAVTEARIAAGLREVRAGRTTLVLTTSPALLAAADRVVVLDRDRRAEGSHAELLHTDAAYRELVLS